MTYDNPKKYSFKIIIFFETNKEQKKQLFFFFFFHFQFQAPERPHSLVATLTMIQRRGPNEFRGFTHYALIDDPRDPHARVARILRWARTQASGSQVDACLRSDYRVRGPQIEQALMKRHVSMSLSCGTHRFV